MIVDNRTLVTTVDQATLTFTRDELMFLLGASNRFARNGRPAHTHRFVDGNYVTTSYLVRNRRNKRMAREIAKVIEGILS